MNSGDIVPDLLRAAPVILALGALILSVRVWARKSQSNGKGDPT